MKHSILICFTLVVGFHFSASAQNHRGAVNETDWTLLWTEYKPNHVSYPEITTVLSGIINKNTTLTKRNIYLLRGIVYVTENAVLTIEPGTIIRGEESSCGTLVITKGAQLIAAGTDTDPIVFTSNNPPTMRKAGDWGGIIILGDAPVNKPGGISSVEFNIENTYSYYGGKNEMSNSGTLKYVRVEYAGRKINLISNAELNGITLAGIGRGTTIENVQVSYCNDDSYELFGGNVLLKKVISYKCTDDDFDFNFGYNGEVHHAIALRHPLITDYSGSRCIEADSYSGGIATKDPEGKFTKVTFVNATFASLELSADMPSYKREAIFVGENCYLSLQNSIVSNFKTVFLSKDKNLRDHILMNDMKITGNLFNQYEQFCVLPIETDQEQIKKYLFGSGLMNTSTDMPTGDLLTEVSGEKRFEFRIIKKELSEAAPMK